MTELLELPAFRQRVHLVSVDDYHRLGEMGLMPETVELLRGIVVTKISKSPLHELVCQKLMKLLLAQVPRGFEVRREGPLTLRDSEPEPDLSVVLGSPDDWVRSYPTNAALVVEVAVSSPAVDEGKADIYAEAGIPEYWLVRPADREVDVYARPAKAAYLSRSTLTDEDTLQSSVLPGVKLTVASVLPSIPEAS
jgi:Uma2 family endonuclease